MIEEQDRGARGGNRFKEARQQVLGDLLRSAHHLHARADLDQQLQAAGTASLEPAQQKGLRLQRPFVQLDRNLALPRARSQQAESKIAVADPDLVAVSQDAYRNRQAVYRGSIAASEIADFKLPRRQFADGAMASRNRAVVDGERIGMVAADGDLLAGQREGASFDGAADADQARIVRLFQTL